jgi:ATP-dependent DNA helicase RecQ
VRLYDIEVEGSHNFFANGALVHNCISSWGHDFRPSFARLGDVIRQVTPEQVLAVTATATEKVKEDICTVLGLNNAKVYVRGIVRENLELCIFNDTGMNRESSIAEAVRDYGTDATGIVYVASKKEADNLGRYLQKRGVRATTYHGGLKDTERKAIQEGWATNGGVVVATSAFGMGIDRADVRFVIHSGFTGSIEEWYQEIGRAGRDGLPSTALTLFNLKEDYNIQMHLIGLTTPDGDSIKSFWKWMRNHAMSIALPHAKTTTVSMTQKQMGGLSQCKCVGAAISFLKGYDLVQTKGRGKYQVSLEKKEIDFDSMAEKRKKNIKKFYDLVNFYKTGSCRFKIICEYFGDDSFVGRCGNCDNCQG